MLMGRPKTHDKELPQHMRKKGNSYYHVYRDKWTPLGSDIAVARIKWAELERVNNKDNFDAALDSYFASDGFFKLADNTKKNYMSRAKVVRAVFGNMVCAAIRPKHIYKFMDECPSRNIANQGLILIQHALEQAKRKGWVDTNHGKEIEGFTPKRRSRYIEDAEFKAIYDNANQLVQAVMKINYLIGQRPIDILKIKLSDITDDGIFVMQQKTKKKQLFVWTPELREAVELAKAIPRKVRGLTLFCSRTGKMYSPNTFRDQWKAACKKAGVENAQFRDIRAKTITDAENDGQDHQALGGHATKAMSDSYVKRFKVQKVEPLRRKI
jgi:integrase